jgi:hypothetical protein
MIAEAMPQGALEPSAHRTCGQAARQLHDVFWNARGATIVRQGGTPPRPDRRGLFLLIDAWSLALFDIDSAINRLNWLEPLLLVVRIRGETRDSRKQPSPPAMSRRIGLTTDPAVALRWHREPSARAWRALRESIPQIRRAVQPLAGRCFDSRDCGLVTNFAEQLAGVCRGRDRATEQALSELRRGFCSDVSSHS